MMVSCPPPAPDYAFNISNSALMSGPLQKQMSGYISLLYDMAIIPGGPRLGKPVDCLLMPDVQIPRQRWDECPL
eukprot:704976-Ditylum_brightwellii.AAC.1